ncbi:SUMF1/EgtB/PvdOfamily nonheme iron enzyme [Anabaena sp. UHCC 0253]|uniref:SUMF1/EgtB/PvdO family nonheme iron enzyme n=1 Tax=Anabaena sp. UHCC 0253 TaxID=2590019 RepID=UPI0014472585|nr:SUMF1/EgtB/PvdOfamily nonheme iron enzyme [Anabaena sp. UHCC 0253]
MSEIKLTVVQLDLVQSSKSTSVIQKQLGLKGIKLFIEEIKKFVRDSFNLISNRSEYDNFYSLGGDGYRILFKDVNNAYEFVELFCKDVNEYNTQSDREPRRFRIGAATGKVLYDKDQSGLDRIIGHGVLFTVARLVTAEPGWFYVDEATYNAFSQNVKQQFVKTSVKGKEHEDNIEAYACPMLSDAAPFMQSFNFKIATIDEKNNIKYQDKEIKEIKIEAKHFIEILNNNVNLEMVSIPGGTFQMGTTDDEIERLCKEYEVDYFKREKSQHSVTVKPFYLGKYPVTQAQWKAVASLSKIKQELNPDPSKFKEANRPVERVSWFDAVEFCLRLSKHTKRQYRLPSEAEWEYACRGGTTTPFHFGETITTDLANYDGKYEGTTEVGSFKVANNFGLYDMHGNVWEWCQDHWYNSYEDAPTDGSAWQDVYSKNNKRLLRGGSWVNNPDLCRSASRSLSNLFHKFNNDIGFRVVCSSAART